MLRKPYIDFRQSWNSPTSLDSKFKDKCQEMALPVMKTWFTKI